MRKCGVLLPMSSLDSPYGIGTLGKQAFEFIDFLHSAGQKCWQMLPIGPTGYGDSPYQSFSAFASNPYFIDVDALRKDGLLTQDELEKYDCTTTHGYIDYESLFQKRLALLSLAAARFDKTNDEYVTFCRQNFFWLDDYALFMALKEANGNTCFYQWDKKLANRDETALENANKKYADRVEFWKFTQYIFCFQWEMLREYAKKNNVALIGDLPIYVSADSADLWAHRELFEVDENGMPKAVAGCPPDAFSADGQLWGNPLYKWKKHFENNCDWWVDRLAHALCFFDTVRIDHFRGFAGYYSIPYGDATAINGHWEKGPGREFIDKIRQRLPYADVIAEDLGYLTDDVYDLLSYSGFPGMKVLQFAFDDTHNSSYLPHKYDKNCVVYTGTHDNPTTLQWFKSAPRADIRFAKEYLGITGNKTFVRDIVRAALASVADTAIIPMQDWLELGEEARINMPSTLGDNWKWRMDKNALTPQITYAMKRYTNLYGR